MRSLLLVAHLASWSARAVHGVDVDEFGATCDECLQGESNSQRQTQRPGVLHELSTKNFETVISSHHYTLVLFHDRLETEARDENFDILAQIASSQASLEATLKSGNSSVPQSIAFASLDVRKHQSIRQQFHETEKNELSTDEYYTDYVNMEDPAKIQTVYMNSTTFMQEIERVYWKPQWTLMDADFNIPRSLSQSQLDDQYENGEDNKVDIIKKWISLTVEQVCQARHPTTGFKEQDKRKEPWFNFAKFFQMYSWNSDESYDDDIENLGDEYADYYDSADDDGTYEEDEGHFVKEDQGDLHSMTEGDHQTELSPEARGVGVADSENIELEYSVTEEDESEPNESYSNGDVPEDAEYNEYEHIYESDGFSDHDLEHSRDMFARYTTGLDTPEEEGDVFVYPRPLTNTEAVATEVLSDLGVLIERYLAWSYSYEELWDSERKEMEDKETNFGFYLLRMNEQIKALLSSEFREDDQSLDEESGEKPLLKDYFQEMVFGYGRSPSSLLEYIDQNVASSSGQSRDTEEGLDLSMRVKEFMKVVEQSFQDEEKYALFLDGLYVSWYNILADFQENITDHYLQYREETDMDPPPHFDMQDIDVLDMSDPEDQTVLSSYAEFEREYTAQGRPVLLANVGMSKHKFTTDLLVDHCGHMDVTDNVQVSDPVGESSSEGWGGLYPYYLPDTLMDEDRLVDFDQSLTLDEFLVLSGAFSDLYLHGVPLPGRCDSLLYEKSVYEESPSFRIPSVLGSYDFYQRMATAQPQTRHPSLFMGRQWTNSRLHRDNEGSAFASYLVSGRKRWVVFDQSERVFLYERLAASSFIPDLLALNLDEDVNEYFDFQFPLLRRAATGGYSFVQEPGDVVVIPPNAPHAVENLEDSVAVSFNFIPRVGVPAYLHELIHGDASFASLEVALRYMMSEQGYGEPVDTKDPLFATYGEYRQQS